MTERTFFRHFPDKREVLFDGGTLLSTALAESLAGMPAGIAPLDMLFRAFHGVLPLLEANRAASKPRHDVIANTPALREREVAKHEAMAVALAAALQSRGVAALPAELAARAGMAAFVQAAVAWLNDGSVSLAAQLGLAQRALETLLTGVGVEGAQPATS